MKYFFVFDRAVCKVCNFFVKLWIKQPTTIPEGNLCKKDAGKPASGCLISHYHKPNPLP